MASTRISFPCSLYLILDIEDASIIRWEPNGLSFKIVNSKRLESKSLPKYFKHANYASTQRQLNLCGFHCVRRNELKGVFFHPLFTRGNYDNVKRIKRMFQPRKRSLKKDGDSIAGGNYNILGQSSHNVCNGAIDEEICSTSSFDEFNQFPVHNSSNSSVDIADSNSIADIVNVGTNGCEYDSLNDEELITIIQDVLRQQ